MKRLLPLLLFALAQASSAQVTMIKEITEGVISNATGMASSAMENVQMQPKPARFDSFSERLDYIHLNFYNDYNTRVHRADAYAAAGLDIRKKPEDSRFRISFFAEASQEDKTEYSFKPEFDAEIDLPNVEKRWKVILNTSRPSELPDTDPTEKPNSLQLGMRTYVDVLRTYIDTGIRVRWLPEAYAQTQWGPNWSWESWRIRPRQKLFYETDDGFGEQTSLSMYRWFGSQNHFAAGGVVAGTYSESSDGFEWVQSVKIGYIKELLDEDDRGHDVGGSDLARGLGLGFVVNGSDTLNTQHKLALLYRRPLYKKWIYLEVDPGIKWKREHDWKADPYLLVGLDLFFWGTSER